MDRKLAACERPRNRCDEAAAATVADCIIGKLDYQPQLLNREITATDGFFTILYLRKEVNIRGGSVAVKISKGQCRVAKVERYQ